MGLGKLFIRPVRESPVFQNDRPQFGHCSTLDTLGPLDFNSRVRGVAGLGVEVVFMWGVRGFSPGNFFHFIIKVAKPPNI